MLDQPPATGDSLKDRMEQVRTEFEQHLAAKLQEREAIQQRHAQELANVQSDIEMLESTLKAMRGEQTAPKATERKRTRATPTRPTVTASGTATGFGVSLEAAEVAADGIKRMVAARKEAGEPETFTQRDFYRFLDWDQSKGSQAVRFLRSIGFLRKAGRNERAELWALMDEDAIVRERQRVNNGQPVGRPIIPDDDTRRQEYKQRAIAVLKERREITGWNALADAAGFPVGSAHIVGANLAREGLISLEGGKGRPKIITWIGEEDTSHAAA